MVVHVDESLDDDQSARRRPSEPRHRSIEVAPERHRVRVRCAGALDAGTAPEMRRECEGLLERGFARVILDLAQTTSIGPAAVSAIVMVQHRARELGGRFSLSVR